MRRRLAVYAGVDLVGDVRKQRSGDADEDVEHGVQRVDGVAVAVPEALAAAPDVPVRQRLDERSHGGAGAEQVVRLHRPGDVLDEVAASWRAHSGRARSSRTAARHRRAHGRGRLRRWRRASGSTTSSTAAGGSGGRCRATRPPSPRSRCRAGSATTTGTSAWRRRRCVSNTSIGSG